MNKPWKVILAFTGIFVAGLLVGGLVTLRWGRNIVQRMPMGERFAPQLMERLAKDLDLTPDQQARLKPIIDRENEELRQLRRTAQRTTAAVLVRLESEIAAVLTPEQKAKFDEQVKARREKMRHFMEERSHRLKGFGDRDMPMPPPDDNSGPPK